MQQWRPSTVKNKQVKCKNIGKCCTQTDKTHFCTVSLRNLWHADLNAKDIYKVVVVHSISQTWITATAIFKNMNCAVSDRIVPCFVGISHVALVVKNQPTNSDSTPGLGRSSGRGHGNPLQYSCLENPMGRGVWWATVHGITRSQSQLSD